MNNTSISVLGRKTVGFGLLAIFLVFVCSTDYVLAQGALPSLGVSVSVESNHATITVAGGTPVTVNSGTSQDFVDSNGVLLFTVTVNDRGQTIFTNVSMSLSLDTGGQVDLGQVDVGVDNEVVLSVDSNLDAGGTVNVGIDIAPQLGTEVIVSVPDFTVQNVEQPPQGTDPNVNRTESDDR